MAPSVLKAPVSKAPVRARTKGALAVVAAAAMVLSGCSSTNTGDEEGSLLERLQDQGSVTVGFAGEAPYSFEENGELTGATVALHREIFGNLGIDTVDVGVPLLSMHSAREMCGVADLGSLASSLGAFFRMD